MVSPQPLLDKYHNLKSSKNLFRIQFTRSKSFLLQTMQFTIIIYWQEKSPFSQISWYEPVRYQDSSLTVTLTISPAECSFRLSAPPVIPAWSHPHPWTVDHRLTIRSHYALRRTVRQTVAVSANMSDITGILISTHRDIYKDKTFLSYNIQTTDLIAIQVRRTAAISVCICNISESGILVRPGTFKLTWYGCIASQILVGVNR